MDFLDTHNVPAWYTVDNVPLRTVCEKDGWFCRPTAKERTGSNDRQHRECTLNVGATFQLGHSPVL